MKESINIILKIRLRLVAIETEIKLIESYLQELEGIK